MAFTKAALALVALVGSAKAQTTFLADPVPLWTTTFSPMADNNGLVWAPDDSLLYATAANGTLGAINPDTGELYNSFQPSGNGTVPFTCNGEVSFSTTDDGSTVIYAVTEGDSCKVYGLSHQQLGTLWTSESLPGVCEGTPMFADDDAYVFVIHNAADGSAGRFTVLDVAAGATTFYNYTYEGGSFGPFGFFANPFPGGNYGAGVGNTNDIAVWGLKPSPGATTGEAGSVFVFQMPAATAIGGPNVTNTIAATSWRYTAPPLLASQGQYLYWLVSRSSVRAWYTSAFSLTADGEYAFDRGSPSFKSAPYTPVVDNIETPTIMCGGPANPEFACFSATNINVADGGPLWSVPTSGSGVYGDPLMSTGGDRVYWTDDAGLVSSAEAQTGAGGWNASTGVTLTANPELSSDGARFFFADTTGNVVAWEVAEGTLPPVDLPALGPPTAPVPTAEGAVPPSPAPSLAPSNPGDTRAPSMSPAPTDEPTISPAPVEQTPSADAGVEPTAAPETSAASSMAVFTVFAAAVVAVVFV
jgi:hypothetical protein